MLTGPRSDAATAATLRRLREIDWDFAAQSSESAFSAVHWHPCRFPSQIPALAIGRMTEPDALVLDPFMGSATTLVEAQRLGRRSIGVDVNPVACLLGGAKTIQSSSADVRRLANTLLLAVRRDWDEIPEAAVPADVQAAKWYMPETLRDLCRLRSIVEAQSDGTAAIIARACFSSILLPACREDRHWGYVCDNTRPIALRSPKARALFVASVERLMHAYDARPRGEIVLEATIVHADAETHLASLPDDYVDLVVTSPPYFGVADYVKAQRLTLEWEGVGIEPLRRSETGARSKRHRKSALADYLSELDRAFAQVHRVMKPGAAAVVVFGQSPTRPDAQTAFIANLSALGFTLQMERRRHIPSGRRQMPSVAQETVLVVRK